MTLFPTNAPSADHIPDAGKMAPGRFVISAPDGNFWNAIASDARLASARSKLSLHELRIIMEHARATHPATAPLYADIAISQSKEP